MSKRTARDIVPLPDSLVRAVRERRIVPLVGAGVSVGVKRGLFPSWKQLMLDLASELEREARADAAARVDHLIHAEDYINAAEVGLRELGSYRFNRFLRERFRKQRPDDVDLDVVEAIWRLSPRLVITTNYDAVMRWGCPVGDVQVVANDQAEELALLDEATSDWPWLWYLHGTIERLSTLILAGSDYRRLYDEDGARSERYERAIFELNNQLATRPFLYVGFSLNDPYVLQQISDILKVTKSKNAPSFALMKQGEGDRGALWSRYNIQLVEYPEHDVLPQVLRDIAAGAFGAGAGTDAEAGAGQAVVTRAIVDAGGDAGIAGDVPDAAGAVRRPPRATPPGGVPPVIATSSLADLRVVIPHVRRPELEEAYVAVLEHDRRLLLLSPRGGGARTLARQLAEERFGGDRVSWLEPPNVPSCTAAEYFVALTGEKDVRGFLELESWLEERARRVGGRHLVVVRHDGGPIEHLTTLGNALRRLIEQDGGERFCVLVAGEAPCAWLRFHSEKLSLFSGAPVRHVPPLTVAEVGAILDRAGHDGDDLATVVHLATGGHPGMVVEVAASGPELARGNISENLARKLARSPSVRGALKMRLRDDDRAHRPERRHARKTLRDLVNGQEVPWYDDVEDDLDHPQIRLYYDGLVVAHDRKTWQLRCEAVRAAAQAILAHEQGSS